MFLRAKTRLKDGKEHRYWSIVENRRTQGRRVVQRQVLYLGEINDSQKASWCKTIEVCAVKAQEWNEWKTPSPIQVGDEPLRLSIV